MKKYFVTIVNSFQDWLIRILKHPQIIAVLIPVCMAATLQIENTRWIAPIAADKITNPVPYTNEHITSGQKIFDKICWVCHNSNGKGNGPAAVDLKNKPADLTSADVQKQSDGALYWKISNGRTEMASYREMLSAKQRWQLVCYLRHLDGGSVQNNNSK